MVIHTFVVLDPVDRAVVGPSCAQASVKPVPPVPPHDPPRFVKNPTTMLIARPCTVMPSVAEELGNAKTRSKHCSLDFGSDDLNKSKSAARRVSALSTFSAISDASTVVDIRRPSHDLSGFEPSLDDFAIGSNTRKYSVASLLHLRKHATPVKISVDYGDSCHNHAKQDRDYSTPPVIDGKIHFRAPKDGKPAPHNAISFHEDVVIGQDCIVYVYNLDRSVGWPILNTFCTKTIGMKPTNIRMERRRDPCKAMVMFESPEAAQKFMGMVPEGIHLKGRRLQFALHSVATASVIEKK